MTETVLLRFRYPSNEILAALREVAAGLEICSPPRFAEPYYTEKDALRGDLETTLERLAADLRRDCEENQRECHSWNGSFDYLIVPSAMVESAVDIKTRLYSTVDSSQGNIFYSRVLERVEDDGFLLWIAAAD